MSRDGAVRAAMGAIWALMLAGLVVLGIYRWVDESKTDRLEMRVLNTEHNLRERMLTRDAEVAALGALIDSLIKHSLIPAKATEKAIDDAKAATGGRPVGPVLDTLFDRLRQRGTAPGGGFNAGKDPAPSVRGGDSSSAGDVRERTDSAAARSDRAAGGGIHRGADQGAPRLPERADAVAMTIASSGKDRLE